MSTSVTIKVGNVPIRLYQMLDGRWRFMYYEAGKRVKRTFTDLAVAKERARDAARVMHNGSIDFTTLNKGQLEVCREALRLGWTLGDVGRMMEAQAATLESVSVAEAVSRFLLAKQGAQGASNRYLQGLKKDLEAFTLTFGARALPAVTSSMMEAWLQSRKVGAVRYNQLRGTLVTFQRWCKARKLLPDRTVEAEHIERRKRADSTVTLYTPEQLKTLLQQVAPRHLAWLALSAFAGLRSEEMSPPTNGSKRPLQWEDVDLQRGLITIHPQTSKTGKRRIIPICPALKDWLLPLHKDSGQVTWSQAAANDETRRLGALIGGWKKNALRHSFGSYRAALVQNLGQVSLEMGNSISVCQSAYHEAVDSKQAEQWFRLGRKVTQKLPTCGD